MTKIKNLLHFCLYVITHPELWRPALKRIYLPILIEYWWIQKYKINTFIDVGAHEGSEIDFFKEFYPDAKIFVFEPLPEFTNLLQRKDDQHLTVVAKAVSDKEGKADFYKNKFTPASSLLPLSKEALKNYHLISDAQKVRVETTTLDKYFEDQDFVEPVFLKLDIQGAEGIALKHGKEVLKKTAIIFIETAFESIYEGQETFEYIYNILHSAGFEFRGIQADGMFEPQFSLPPRVNCVFINNKKIVKR